jgi:hypothetical protein
MRDGDESMKRTLSKTFILLVGAILIPSRASGQEVSQERIIKGFGKLTLAAPAIDLEILRQEAVNGGDRPMSGLPNWKRIAKLPQMVVEINFENAPSPFSQSPTRTLGCLPTPCIIRTFGTTNSSSSVTRARQVTINTISNSANSGRRPTTFAVDPQRLYAVGVGERLPIAGTDADASNNRRVQLINLGVFKKKS